MPSSDPDINTLMSQLRDLLHAEPSAVSWAHVCDLFAVWPEGDLQVGVDYACEHLEQWPDAVRLMPIRWHDAWISGEHDERHRLVRGLSFQYKGLGREVSDLLHDSRMAQMRVLDLRNLSIGRFYRDHGLVTSPHLGELTQLSLKNNGINSGPFTLFAGATATTMPKLEWLSVANNGFGVTSAKTLANNPSMVHLRYLDADKTKIGANGVKAIANSKNLPALATLSLQNNALGAKKSRGVHQLAAGSELANLHTLLLSNNQADGASIVMLARASFMEGLHTLALSDNAVGPVGLKALINGPAGGTLRVLELRNSAINNKAIERLADSPHLGHLEALVLSENPLDAAGVQHMLQSPHLRPSLKRLDLSGIALGLAGVEALASNPALTNLTHLNLQQTSLDRRALEALVCSPYLTQLTHLDLADNRLGRSLEPLMKGTAWKLCSLNLTGNMLSAVDLRAFQDADPEMLTALHTLDLSNNYLGGGADAIRHVCQIPALRALRNLRLANCGLYNHDAIRPLCDSPYIRNLRLLDVRRNSLFDAGAKAIAGSSNFASLWELDISYNRLSASGARALGASTHLNSAIRDRWAAFNPNSEAWFYNAYNNTYE